LSSTKWPDPITDKASKKMIEEGEYIYVIQAEDSDLIKIGRSKQPTNRVGSLQTGCPYELRIRLIWQVEDMKTAELLVHKAMKPFNVQGQKPELRAREWFFMPEGGLERVKQLVKGAVEVAQEIQLVRENY